MRFEWSPSLGPLNGAFLFLSASVPDPKRHQRFLDGPVDEGTMLRVIDRRVDDAVQSLLSQTLTAGGRIVHGGHPKITAPIAHQANQWKVPEGVEPPIRIYQSALFANAKAPLGREEMIRAGVGVVCWVPADLSEIVERRKIPSDLIERQLPFQAASGAPPGLAEALLAMRIEMLMDSQPTSAICIGGMEGIEAEARLYLELAKMGLIPAADHVNVMGSTYGASAQLGGEGIRLIDHLIPAATDVAEPPASDATGDEGSAPAPNPFGQFATLTRRQGIMASVDPNLQADLKAGPATAQAALQTRLSYDHPMRSLIARIASSRTDS